MYIEGRLRTREYDGSDGLRRHTTEIVAETMKLLDRPRTDDAAPHDDVTAGAGADSAPPDAHVGASNGERGGKRNRVEVVPAS